jgi:subtilisin family serine protease
MRKIATCLIILLTIPSTSAFAPKKADTDPIAYTMQSKEGSFVEYVENEFSILLKDNVAVDQTADAKFPVALSHLPGFNALAATFEVDRIKSHFPGSDKRQSTFPPVSRRLARYYKVRFSRGTLKDAMEAYAKNPFVENVEPIAIHMIDATPNDPNYGIQWHLDMIDAPEAWDISTGSSSVIIAILDTGVRYYHKDLGGKNASSANAGAARGNMWLNPLEFEGTPGFDDDINGYIDDWIGYDFVDGGSDCWTGEDCNVEDNDPRDFHGHGTHCAGIAGAINNNGYFTCSPAGGWGNGAQEEYGNGVKIMACRVGWSYIIRSPIWPFEREGGCVTMDFCATAFNYARVEGAKIASCSWGSSYYGPLADAVTDFVGNGGLVFKAAGNNNSEAADYLCSRSDVISVAATDENDSRWTHPTDPKKGSNYGTWVDISAPGVGIWSSYHKHSDPSPDYIEQMTGTSMATPLAASVAALIWSKNPGYSASDVKRDLFCCADYIGEKLGAGRVNAYASVAGIYHSFPPEIRQDTLTFVEQGQLQAYIPFEICNPDLCFPQHAYGYQITSRGYVGAPLNETGTSIVPSGACMDVYGIIDAYEAPICDWDTLTIVAWTTEGQALYDTCVQIIHVIEPQPVPMLDAPAGAILVLALVIVVFFFVRRRATGEARGGGSALT